MKTSVFILIILLLGCAPEPSAELVISPNSTGPYRQDIEQCMVQPELIWCVEDCKTDTPGAWCQR